MMTVEEFQSLQVGDQLELEPLLPKIDDEPVVLTMTGSYRNRHSFIATFYGIPLRTVEAIEMEGKIRWI